ncbi:metallophosphoesterase [Haliangium ochraceum]|uniref:Metallophosphoesterase n=1 Tax=Haliangium ochraceum (strain DSM 14365 / JCM 11303 / SMP-2) TaxID=502025 RepID=D0LN08_HALO1|nr:metallophosphoesterase [Haliangium ochraceum]ACY13379.1 metallophosphoesterase [Haliangium ochraceum DSM 14365]
MHLAWATDIHLNFLSDEQLFAFCSALAGADADAIAITGDIAEAPSLARYMTTMAERVNAPIYFVLGNHDFYRGDIASVRAQAEALTRTHARLWWMPTCGVVELSDDVALIGHDGWGDGRLGSGIHSPIMLNDFVHIADLRLWGAERMAKIAALGDEAAAHIRDMLTATASYRRVIVLTHVPPFREACWHEGEISDDDWLPWFTCKAVGDVLLEAAEAHPQRTIDVLCGHTHGAGMAQMRPNLRILTGGAEYGAPQVQPLLEV